MNVVMEGSGAFYEYMNYRECIIRGEVEGGEVRD